MVETNLDPPAVKPGLFKRMLCVCTPKKWHKYYTAEVFVAWNISSVATDIKWLGILAVPWDVVMPIVRVYWAKILSSLAHGGKFLKEVVLDFWTLLHAGT